MLALRYDPKSAETKRALMKQITIPKTPETTAELDKNIMDWEYNVRRYEEACESPWTKTTKSVPSRCVHAISKITWT